MDPITGRPVLILLLVLCPGSLKENGGFVSEEGMKWVKIGYVTNSICHIKKRGQSEKLSSGIELKFFLVLQLRKA